MRKTKCILLLQLLMVYALNAQDMHKLDSLENTLSSLNTKDQLKTYSDLCWGYGQVDIDKALKFGQQAKLLALQQGDSLDIALTYNDLGIIYYRQSQYDSALHYLFKALPLRRNHGDSSSVASVASKIGATFQEQGKFKESTKYQIEALHIYQNLGDSIHASQCLNNLARVYFDNGDYANSLLYNRQALPIFEKYKYTTGIATVLGSIALCYEKLNQNDSAIIILEKALNIFREIGDKSNESTALLGLGKLYRKLGETDKGIMCYVQAIELSEQVGEKHAAAVARANLAGFYVEEGAYQKARKLLHQALQTAHESHIPTLMHQCYRELSTLHKKTGEYKKALEYKQLQYDLHDSIFNKEKYKEIARLQTQFETVQKEQKIKLLNTKDQLNHLKIKRQQYSILIIGIAFILLAFISFLLINRRKLKQKALLEKAHSQYRKELLNASVEAQEKERQRIARELHDGIAQQLTGLKMAWQNFGKEIDPSQKASIEKLKDLTKTLDESADEVRNLSHQMMPRSLSENGLISAMEDMLEKSLKYTQIAYTFEHFALDKRLDEKLELSLYRISQELINNIIKHSGASEVRIQLLKSKRYIVLMVEDNGKGFSSEKNKGKGIGMMNIASRIDTINGEINIEPSPGSGTVATVRVPLKKE